MGKPSIPCCSHTDLGGAGSQHAGRKRPKYESSDLISPGQREASSLVIILCFWNSHDGVFREEPTCGFVFDLLRHSRRGELGAFRVLQRS